MKFMKYFFSKSHSFFKIFSICAISPTELKNNKTTLPDFVSSKTKIGIFQFKKKNETLFLQSSTTKFSRQKKRFVFINTKLIPQTFQYKKRTVMNLCLNLASVSHFQKKEETKYTDCQFQQKSEYKIIRPLLNLSRKNITCFCQSLQLPIYPDKSNQTLFFSRNKIRKQILPSIKLFLNPQVENSIFQFAEWITKENFLLKYD